MFCFFVTENRISITFRLEQGITRNTHCNVWLERDLNCLHKKDATLCHHQKKTKKKQLPRSENLATPYLVQTFTSPRAFMNALCLCLFRPFHSKRLPLTEHSNWNTKRPITYPACCFLCKWCCVLKNSFILNPYFIPADINPVIFFLWQRGPAAQRSHASGGGCLWSFISTTHLSDDGLACSVIPLCAESFITHPFHECSPLMAGGDARV